MKHAAFIALLVGCGGSSASDIKPTLEFAPLPQATIDRLVNAAGGTDMFDAETQVMDQQDTTCPSVATSGDVVTITGGCTTAAGMMVSGSAVLTNTGAFETTSNPANDQVFEFDQLAFTAGSTTSASYDGEFHVNLEAATYSADLTVDSFGVTVRSLLSIHCNLSSKSCDLGGSGLELIDPMVGGGAQVSGSLADTSPATGSIDLVGADQLAVTYAQGCVTTAISDGAQMQVCGAP
ncbi:MAG TPA: hypothetical protein VMJ10_29140 [Kofleriaceae bacterium]|nr:hypothetical protein [Kofleriaceae bacterium]